MSHEQWQAIDQYFEAAFIGDDPILAATLADSEAAHLPPIHIAPNQGKFLALLAQIQGARTILEIGTLGGYSSIWLARALPADGRLVTLEYDAAHARVAQANITRAGVAHQVEIMVGAALDSLPKLIDHPAAPFDMIFIDADKPNNPHYLDWALRLARVGSVIIGDNVVRRGEVLQADSADENVQGIRRFVEAISDHPRLDAIALQTVGCKGYDGFSLARVVS